MSDSAWRLRIYVENALRSCLDLVLLLLSFVVPKRDGLWSFASHYTFAGNSKYLYLYVSDNAPDVDPVWITDDVDVIERLEAAGYDAVHPNTVAGILTLLRSQCAFVTHNMQDLGHWSSVWFRTRAVNLTHGTPMMGASTDSLNRKQRVISTANDFLVVTSAHAADAFRRARLTPTDETVLATGYPRNDALFSEFEDPVHEDADALRARLADVDPGADLIFYLPTKRGYPDENPLIDDESNLRELDGILGSVGAHLLIKRHPSEPAADVDGTLENVTTLDSSLDAHLALPHADSLVTDYSSVYLPFLLLDRPIVFFPYDFDRFSEARDLLYEYEDITPGPTVSDPQALFEALADVATGGDDFRETRTEVRNVYHEYRDGDSCERLLQAFRSDEYDRYTVD